MLNCERCQILLADSLYEELDPVRARLRDEHLAECSACTDLYAQLYEQVQNIAQCVPTSSPTSVTIDSGRTDEELWDSLQSDLDRIDAQRFRQMPRGLKHPWLVMAYGLAASIVVAVSLLLVRPAPTEAPPQLSDATLVSPELMDYLDKAQVMLLLVANSESDNVSVIPIRQTLARDMAIEASTLGANLNGDVNVGQEKLLKDIEYLLLQLANLDESNMLEGVALMQQFMEQSSVLFKIRLLEMRSQAQASSQTQAI